MEKDYSEGMSEDQTKRYVQYLVDRVNDAELDNRAIYLVLEDFLKAQQDMLRQLSELHTKQTETDTRLTEEIRRRRQAEQKSKKLES